MKPALPSLLAFLLGWSVPVTVALAGQPTPQLSLQIEEGASQRPTAAPVLPREPDEAERFLGGRLAGAEPVTDSRPPRDEDDLRAWLENMLVEHQFTTDEACAATGLSSNEVAAAVGRWDLAGRRPSPTALGQPLKLLPYPGGRHPRRGFLEGALRPQRETKVSVFTPWDPGSYVVVDVPEAIWSSLGLTYLAHTHIPTVWDTQGVALPRLEWLRSDAGTLVGQRVLPNGIAFGATVIPETDGARFQLWLRNDTPDPLRNLRAQVCVLLAGVPEFSAQVGDNKVLRAPYAACRSTDGSHWVITAWAPLDRVWHNPPVPCIHSDPSFPDCAPGKTVQARGRLWFYEGTDLETELRRLDATGWADDPA